MIRNTVVEYGDIHVPYSLRPCPALYPIEEDGFCFRLVESGVGYRRILAHVLLKSVQIGRRVEQYTDVISISQAFDGRLVMCITDLCMTKGW
jgi:hypothetical protein